MNSGEEIGGLVLLVVLVVLASLFVKGLNEGLRGSTSTRQRREPVSPAPEAPTPERPQAIEAPTATAEVSGGPAAMAQQPAASSVEQPTTPTTTPAATSEASRVERTTASIETRDLFICYRRGDSEVAAGWLREMFAEAYGSNRVFMDIDSVPLGDDFVDRVAEELAGCHAVIVVIGPQWLTIQDKSGGRRLTAENDLVRTEVAAALQKRIPVIPVFVQDAEMPPANDLPEDLRPLTRRNGLSLSAARWRTDVERLIKELDRVMKPGFSCGKRVAIRPTVEPGTARMGPSGLTAKPSADLIVYNAGDPFQLVAHARLLRVSDGYKWEQTDRWEYEPRMLKGGNGKTWYHIATVDPASDVGRKSVVGVRAEHMVVIRRWETKEQHEKQPLWFDVEWMLYNEIDNTLHHIETVVTRVTLNKSPVRRFDGIIL